MSGIGEKSKTDAATFDERLRQLKKLLARLNEGEPLQSVRADFVRNFADVSADEIAAAEQRLIGDGIPIGEVQKLCDVHSALFRDKIETKTESPDIRAVATGHPLQILCAENAGLERLLDVATKALENNDAAALANCFSDLHGLYSHYGKKEMLLMPILYRYGVTGPSGVMWSVDDEIKRELRELSKKISADNIAELRPKILAWLQRVREMIHKEEKILFPLTLRCFTQQDWCMTYRDAADMGVAFIDEPPKWEEGERLLAAAKENEARSLNDAGTIRLATGEISLRELQAILSLLPVDVTFIDKDDVLRFFVNEGKIFARPRSVLGDKVYNCHPADVLPVLRQLLDDFKTGKRDRMEVWKTIKGKPVGVQYFAVRDTSGEYMGAVEIVQDFTGALSHFGGKK